MKISILAYGFTGANLPLAKYLNNLGHEVTAYFFCSNESENMESLNFGHRIPITTQEYKIPLNNSLYKYLPKQISVSIVSVFKERHRLKKYFVGYIPLWINLLKARKIAQKIAMNSDYVIMVCQTDLDLLVARYLVKKQVKICIAFHEVLNNLEGDTKLRSIVEKAISLGTPVVVHSQNTKNELLEHCKDKTLSSRLSVHYFGVFESFLQYGEGKPVSNVGDDYILFLGRISKYKGLNVLNEAIKILQASNIPYNVVIAGNGYVPEIEELQKDPYVKVIKGYIDNPQLVFLMRHCKAVVCPYLAASQSGLVQTAACFGKSVIASNVGAFPEVIENGTNGLLFDNGNSRMLANMLKQCYINGLPYNSIQLSERFNWNYIAKQYISLMDY